MINVSNEFLLTMEERTNFMESATITFANGEVLELAGDDFTLSNNSLSDSAGTQNFPLGVALEKVIQIEIFNEDDHLWNYNFYGAEIRLKLSLALSETTETIDYGTYTVLTPETYGTTVIVEAVDDMYKADVEYDTNLTFPCTLREIVQDSCSTTGIYLLTTTFRNDQFVVLEKPESLTHREVIAMAAMIACGYARMDYQGRLCINSYDISMFDTTDGLDGGIFDNSGLDNSIELEGGIFDDESSSIYKSGSDATGGSFNPWDDGEEYNGGSPEQYETGDWADGGSFNPWDEGDELNGGSFEDMATYHNLYNFSANGLFLETDDVVITGIQIANDDEEQEVYLCGEEGYVLEIENDLAEGKEEEVVSLIGAALIGFRFRPFEGDHIAYPLAEYGDVAVISDRKGRSYQTVLTDIDFTFRGYTTFKCSAESPLRNSSSFSAASDYVKAVKEARKNTEEKLSEYDKQMQMLANLMANSLGVYQTEEVLEDGSVIYYLHDKPTLTESATIWKFAADGFAVSTDGGKTWNAGITSDGNLIANVLSVIGINFDWAHGGTLTLGNTNNESGWMKILDASGNQIGKWDKDGIEAQKGTFAGVLSAVEGTFTSIYTGSHSLYDSQNDGFYAGSDGLSLGSKFRVTEAGALKASDGDFTGTVTATAGYIGGTSGWKIASKAINSIDGPTSLSSTTSGTYVGTDGFTNNAAYNGSVIIGTEYGNDMHVELGNGALTITDDIERTTIALSGAGLAVTYYGGGTYYFGAGGQIKGTTLTLLNRATISGQVTCDANLIGNSDIYCYGTLYYKNQGYIISSATDTYSLKTNRASIDEEECETIFEDIEAVVCTDEDGRTKIEIDGPKTLNALEDSGIDTQSLSFIKNVKDEDEDKEFTAISYDEIVGLLVHEVQNLKKEVNDLKAQLAQ